MDEVHQLAPLGGRRFASSDISLEPAPYCERVALRAAPDAITAIGRKIGISLPVKPKTSKVLKKITALWLGPDEWLIMAPDGSGLTEKFSGLDGQLFSAVDISHRNTAIFVEGTKAASTLNAGCPQDLSITAFPKGACSRTILGKAEIILQRETPERFRVECWRSFSDYVWNFLVDAGKSA